MGDATQRYQAGDIFHLNKAQPTGSVKAQKGSLVGQPKKKTKNSALSRNRALSRNLAHGRDEIGFTFKTNPW
jgi:hypothetical protein